MAFICMIPGCQKDFPSLKALSDHQKDPSAVHGDPKPQVVNPPPTPPAPKKAIPIELVYVYRGECPVCIRPVETLDLELDGKLVYVAFCTYCKKKLESKTVIPINKQKVV